MIGWLRRSRDAGGSLMSSLMSSPARPVARRGAGSVAAAAMALGFMLWPTASGAGIAEAGHPRGGGHRGSVEWAGFAGNAQHTATARICRVAFCPSTTAPR